MAPQYRSHALLLSIKLTIKVCFHFADAYGATGRPSSGSFPEVPADATVNVSLELVSWKKVEDVTGE
jgi:hypothetical protein